MNKVKVVQFGIGGWGWHFFDKACAEWPDSDYVYEGVIDPRARLSPIYEKIMAMGIPIYESPEGFYREHEAQLAVITASIPAHYPMTLLALEHGSNVLCEKPAASTVQEVDKMFEASQREGKFVAINFNRCFAPASINAKHDFLAGKFGAPKRFRIRSICGRDDSYFFRNDWSCRIRDAQKNLVLDSVLCNGTSHELQHAYFMHGNALTEAASPVSLRADLLRANHIETFDTCALNAHTDGGADVFLYVTHATDYTEFPVYDYEYERATLRYDRARWGDDLVAEMADGRLIHYGAAFPDGTLTMKICAKAILDNTKPICGLTAARSHVLTVDALADYCEVRTFPANSVTRDTTRHQSYVPGLGINMIECYRAGVLLSDIGAYSLPQARRHEISNYTEYMGGTFNFENR